MPSRSSLLRWSTPAALTAGLLLRLLFLLHHPRWVGDTQVYADLAQNLLAHHVYGFSDASLQPTLIRLPGYPLFLAACFALFGHANDLAVACVQIALDLFGCVLLGRLAARLYSPRAGHFALWLAALCPFTANYTAAILTETVSIFCVTLALFALERWSNAYQVGQGTDPSCAHPQSLSFRPERSAAEKPPHFARSAESASTSPLWPLTLGFALSLAVLVRPDQGLLAAALIPAMLWRAFTTPHRSLRSRLQPALLASLVVALPLLLWGVRNWRVFHVIQPLAPRYANDPGETVAFGFQRWYCTWGVEFQSTYDTYWAYDGAPLDLAALPNRAFDSPQQRAATAALIDRYNVQQSPTPDIDAAFAQLAAARIAAHPLRYYVELPLARLANMWLRPRTELLRIPIVWWTFADPAGSAFALFFALVNAAYLALALAGLLRSRGSDRALLVAMLAFVALRCALLLTLDNSEPRYTLECFPILFLLSSPLASPRPRNLNTTNH